MDASLESHLVTALTELRQELVPRVEKVPASINISGDNRPLSYHTKKVYSPFSRILGKEILKVNNLPVKKPTSYSRSKVAQKKHHIPVSKITRQLEVDSTVCVVNPSFDELMNIESNYSVSIVVTKKGESIRFKANITRNIEELKKIGIDSSIRFKGNIKVISDKIVTTVFPVNIEELSPIHLTMYQHITSSTFEAAFHLVKATRHIKGSCSRYTTRNVSLLGIIRSQLKIMTESLLKRDS